MTPGSHPGSNARHTDDDRRVSALHDSDRASDPVAFIAPAQKEPNDTPLDKECGKSR